MARKKKKKPSSLLLKAVIALVALVIITVPVLLGAVIYLNAPVKPGAVPLPSQLDGIIFREDGVFIEVRRGESAQSVGRRLEGAGLINNRLFWQLLCRLDSEPVKAGAYLLQVPASQMAIHRLLVSGRQILHRVTIPEGVTLKKIAGILQDAGICSADDFLEEAANQRTIGSYRIPNPTMEGYLFPDTYLFPKEYPASLVIKSMADTFFSRMEIIYPSVVDLTPQEINRRVIIASIVEREYRIGEEAPLMAGVFFNRLRIGMALQSCATVEYIITEIQGRPHPKVIYNRDLEIRSPYNTYLVPGLPPGPISAPGETALGAAFFPEETDFLYFRLEDPSAGKHYFSKTLDEHIKAGELVPKGQF